MIDDSGTYKGIRALVFVSFLGIFSVLFGLFLIFSSDTAQIAQAYSENGAVYLIEGSKSVGQDRQTLFLEAYKSHIEAVKLAPDDAQFWVRLAYAAYALDPLSDQSDQVLQIAYALDSSLDVEAYTQQMRMFSGAP